VASNLTGSLKDSSGRRLTFLVVSDHPSIRLEIANELERQGHVVEAVASTEDEACEMVKTARIDYVVLDVSREKVREGEAEGNRLADRLGVPVLPLIATSLRLGKDGDVSQKPRPSDLRQRSPFTTAMLHGILNALPESVLIIDADGTIVLANETAAARLGTRVDVIIGECVYDLLPRHLAERRAEYVQEVLRTGLPARLEDVRAGMHIDSSVHPLPDRDGKTALLLVLGRDITARRRMEEEARERHRFIEKVAETTPDVLYVYDLQERCNIYANRNLGVILGFTPEQAVAMGDALMPTLAHPDDLERIARHHREFETATDGEIREIAYRMRRADGEWRWLSSRDTVFERMPDGRPRSILGCASDSTQRRWVDAALRESEERYRGIIESLGDAVLIFDLDGRIVDANPRSCESLGRSAEELRSLSVVDADALQEPGKMLGIWDRLSEGPVTVPGLYRRKDGGTFAVEVRLSRLRHLQKPLVLAIARDLTGRDP